MLVRARVWDQGGWVFVFKIHSIALSPRGHKLGIPQHRLSLHVLWYPTHHHHELLLLLLIVHDLIQDVHVLYTCRPIETRDPTVVLP